MEFKDVHDDVGNFYDSDGAAGIQHYQKTVDLY